ncbi:ferritin-like domain-containing protein [Consotaella aegiceratis]|uniref:ferritin-like domain-containing protein n=1 Tax=Consotaella aegiceratis TaxID=3097961 RepID=UPI002F40C1F5
MATKIGTESDFGELVQNLLTLEHDAIAAYESTIERLDSAIYKDQVSEFKSDHMRHVVELTALAQRLGVEPPTEGDLKQYLTTGKVALASMMGEQNIMKAMATNEDDTVAAYENASTNTVADAAAIDVFKKALTDEHKHRAWFKQESHSHTARE